MNKEYVFNDPTMRGKTIIKLGNGTLTISRPGVISKFSHGFAGEKTILFNQISAIQIKKSWNCKRLYSIYYGRNKRRKKWYYIWQ